MYKTFTYFRRGSSRQFDGGVKDPITIIWDWESSKILIFRFVHMKRQNSITEEYASVKWNSAIGTRIAALALVLQRWRMEHVVKYTYAKAYKLYLLHGHSISHQPKNLFYRISYSHPTLVSPDGSPGRRGTFVFSASPILDKSTRVSKRPKNQSKNTFIPWNGY